MRSTTWRNIEQKIFLSVCSLAALIASLMLFFIIAHIFLNAIPSLSLYFILTPESETPKIGQGIANAIVGTVMISLISTILATPIAVGTAIYLQRYAKEGRAVRFFRYMIEVLSGTPSIILGIFGLLLIAIYLGPFTGGFSLISGSIALTILIIPVIERAAEDAIQGTDRLLEEGSYALGATKWETLKGITIPTALSGILTGVILGFGRAAEESAVVILTAGYSQFMPEFAIRENDKFFSGFKVYPFQDVIGTLPYSVYHAYENSNVIPLSNGFAAAFILICIVLAINLSTKIIFWYSTRTTKRPPPLLTSLARSLFNGGGRFSRTKPVPVPACAAAELADAERESAIRENQIRTMHNTPIIPSSTSRTSEPDRKETLTAGLQVSPVAASGSRDLLVPSAKNSIVIPGEDPSLPGNPGGGTPDSDGTLLKGALFDDDGLFEDGPVLLSDAPGGDAESSFTPEYPLLEEDPASPFIEPPTDEPWRRMTRNRLENTIAGITSDPWEGP